MTGGSTEQADIAVLKEISERTERKVDDLTNLLQDNGGIGLCSRVQKLATHVKVQWWLIGSGIGGMITLGTLVVFKSLG